MKSCKFAAAVIAFALSINVNAALISTLTSFDNMGGLIAGDQSNTTINDWVTGSVFQVGESDITVEGLTAVFGLTNDNTSQYLKIGVYESIGTHSVDLAAGALIGSFDTSTIYSSNTKLTIDLAAYSSFVLQSNTDYLLVWNAQPGTPFLGEKRKGTSDQMINDGTAGVFTGKILSSQDGGSSWFSSNQYGFDYASLNGTVSAVPVPAAIWLFGSGLLGLIGISRRKTG
jgi:hypothetical protein